eukprot:scaffold78917_cov33-Tisochrysis_lutea.AAC.3
MLRHANVSPKRWVNCRVTAPQSPGRTSTVHRVRSSRASGRSFLPASIAWAFHLARLCCAST